MKRFLQSLSEALALAGIVAILWCAAHHWYLREGWLK